ncbi:hypothetical protein JJQ72_04460 [Paenibacillus sp. F411]|uniref:Putative membrane protein n=1 Tax=Paenibacillus algicola TaxID=2565926 RepID=A0A4P8XIP5_9BACL|nr:MULTISPECIES: hypothetical protein [Paenibacillus]MBO2943233.1 hypothetical protein [Paenibacillus sp. F411]QCT02208.1 putative membrane protein [Paenibacillus algicola]
MSSKKDLALGLFIIAAGLFILLGKLGFFAFLGRNLWPLLLLVPGVLLHLWYFTRRRSAELLIPAGILTVYGVLFLICSLGGWHLLNALWPILILGVGVGIYEYDFFESPRSRGAFLVSSGLIALSLLLLVFTWWGTSVIYVVALGLIIAGVWMIYGRSRKKNSRWSRGW